VALLLVVRDCGWNEESSPPQRATQSEVDIFHVRPECLVKPAQIAAAVGAAVIGAKRMAATGSKPAVGFQTRSGWQPPREICRRFVTIRDWRPE
jgi:hypothetical protein